MIVKTRNSTYRLEKDPDGVETVVRIPDPDKGTGLVPEDMNNVKFNILDRTEAVEGATLHMILQGKKRGEYIPFRTSLVLKVTDE